MSYNPNQPRDPAGTPTGGRWSSVEGAARGAAGLSKKKPKYDLHDVSTMDEDNMEYAASQFDGQAYAFLQNALQETLYNGATAPKILIDDNGFPLAFYKADWYPSDAMEMDMEEGDELEGWTDEIFKIEWLGSAGPGGGSAALMEAVREALDGGATMLFLESTWTSSSFYDRMGMHIMDMSSRHFWWSRDEMELVLQEYDRRE